MSSKCIRPGSGAVITSLGKILGNNSALYIAADINDKAALVASKTAKANDLVNIECLVSDLLEGMRTRLKNNVDILLFNPPYVVTPTSEVGTKYVMLLY